MEAELIPSEDRGVDYLATRMITRPHSLEDTGLDHFFVADLLLKHLNLVSNQTLQQLSRHMALPGAVLEPVINMLRQEAKVESRSEDLSGKGLRYALTDRGRSVALDALSRDGYCGPAPVLLSDYDALVRRQSVSRCVVTEEDIHRLFRNTVVEERLLAQLGPAVHSGRAMFIYGPAGSGKSYISRQLVQLLAGPVYIPYSILVGDTVINLFDPEFHHPIQGEEQDPVHLTNGHDPRYVLCHRPEVTTGGELTLDMLDLKFDEQRKQYQAPIQLKASNGMLLIDDLGRQRVAHMDLLNRWIVPMEEKRDFLNLRAGQHFAVPFDMLLIFSTNLNPLDLADEAFLRRIGHKIGFKTLEPEQYLRLWQQVCQEMDIEDDPEVTRIMMAELYPSQDNILLPCHPRDLLGLVRDYCRYRGVPPRLSEESIRWAWKNYFVHMDNVG